MWVCVYVLYVWHWLVNKTSSMYTSFKLFHMCCIFATLNNIMKYEENTICDFQTVLKQMYYMAEDSIYLFFML